MISKNFHRPDDNEWHQLHPHPWFSLSGVYTHMKNVIDYLIMLNLS